MDSVGPTLLGNMFLIEEEVPRRTSSSAAPDAAGVGSFVSCEWSPGHLPHKSAEISVTYQAVWVDAEEKPEKSGGVGLPCIKWARLEENQATFFLGGNLRGFATPTHGFPTGLAGLLADFNWSSTSSRC